MEAVLDVLPGSCRIIFACTLPLLMIGATFVLQKKAMLNAGSPLCPRERSAFDRNNALLLNRSLCATATIRHASCWASVERLG